MSLCEFEVSETCEMRGAVRADVAIWGVGVMKSAGFWEKSTDFCRIRLASVNQIPEKEIIRGALKTIVLFKCRQYFRPILPARLVTS